MYSEIENKEFAETNQWVESMLNTISYCVLVVGGIGSFLFAIIDWGSSYHTFDIDEFNFWMFLLALFCTALSFISWKSLAVIIRSCIKYLDSK